jgi:CBS domain-containing protein
MEETQHYNKLPVFVHYGDLLETVAKTMRNNHVHRVYVVDDSRKPLGVISTSDLTVLLAASLIQTASGV